MSTPISEHKELRGLAPADLVRALDAIALAKGQDRNQYVVTVLEQHVRAYLAEMTVVAQMLKGNTLLPESTRRGSE